MRRVKFLMLLGLFAAIMGCSKSGNEQPDNKYMVDLLAQRHSIVNPIDMQYYYNSKRASVYDSMRQNTDPKSTDYVFMSYWFFRETLNSGNTEKAIELTEPFLEKLYNQEIKVGEQEISFFERLLATSYIRLGEQENCIINHGSASCIIPIAPEGFHSIRTGSEKAIVVLERMLAKLPDDLELKWLLNIAYQTLGEYPDNVPEDHLIPLEAFQNESDSFNSRFEDVAPDLGIDISGLAGGSIMEDFNNDGFLDVLVTSSGFKRSDQMRLFLNDGAGNFSDHTEKAGLRGLVGGLNCVQTDYNNDGNIDIFVLRGGWFGKWGKHPNSLLRNNGNGTFSDVTKEAGILSFNPTQTCVWADFNNDGWLDLFIGNETNVGGNSMQVNRREVHPSEFYLNNGDGTFEDAAKRTGLSQTKLIKGATAIDANGDGNMDLYLSIMGGANKLFINNGKMKFVDQAANFGVQEPFVSFPVGSFDYNNDGNEDLFISGYSTSNNTLSFENAYEFLGNKPSAALPKLFRNNGDGSFTDVTEETGMNKSIYGMGFNYGDLDNDGFLDIYFGTGDPNFESIIPNRMFRNVKGEYFEEVSFSGGFANIQKGHGISWGDVDNDGDEDIYLTMGGAHEGDIYQNQLLINPGTENNWINIKLKGEDSNSSAIGAVIHLVTSEGQHIYRTVSSGASFGANTYAEHIGIAKATGVESLEITWPNGGEKTILSNLQINQFIQITEGERDIEVIDKKPVTFKSGDHAMHKTDE